jgi:hypothetical protein
LDFLLFDHYDHRDEHEYHRHSGVKEYAHKPRHAACHYGQNFRVMDIVTVEFIRVSSALIFDLRVRQARNRRWDNKPGPALWAFHHTALLRIATLATAKRLFTFRTSKSRSHILISLSGWGAEAPV